MAIKLSALRHATVLPCVAGAGDAAAATLGNCSQEKMLSLGRNEKKPTQNWGCSIIAGSRGVANQLLHGTEPWQPWFAHSARFIAVFMSSCLPSMSKGAAKLRMIPQIHFAFDAGPKLL